MDLKKYDKLLTTGVRVSELDDEQQTNVMRAEDQAGALRSEDGASASGLSQASQVQGLELGNAELAASEKTASGAGHSTYRSEMSVGAGPSAAMSEMPIGEESSNNGSEPNAAASERPLTGNRQWKDLYAAIAQYAKNLKISRER